MIDENERQLRSLNVSSLEHTFAGFKIVAGINDTLIAFKSFAKELDPPLLLCWGSIGGGKTYMLEATAISLHKRGIFARVSVWSGLRNALIFAMKDKGRIPTYEQILSNYCKAPVLLLDDYGMGSYDSAWERAVLEEITNFRYSRRMPFALTTNMPVSDLPERVVSRFSEPGIGVIVENKAGDYRRRSLNTGGE